MKLEFDSIEEATDFVDRYRTGGRGMPARMPNEDIARELSVIRHNDKIGAIKMYRYITGADLITSKNAIDRFWLP